MSAEYLQIKAARSVPGVVPAPVAAQRFDAQLDPAEPSKDRYVSPEQQLGMELSWLPDMLWRRRRLLAVVTALGPILSAIYVSISPALYTATARILIENRSPKIISSESVVPDLGNPDAVVLSQVEVLRSSRWADRVIRSLGLFGVAPSKSVPLDLVFTEDGMPAGMGKVPEVAGSTEPAEPMPPHIDDSARAMKEDPLPSGLIEQFMTRLNVHRVDPTTLIDVAYTDPNPDTAAEVANAIVDLYLEDQVQSKSAATRRANEWLRVRIGRLKEQVREREDEIERFKAEHGLFDVGQQSLSERMLSATSDQLVSARTAADAAQAKLEQVERFMTSKSDLIMPGAALQSELLREFRRQYADVTRKKTNLIVRFGAQHPEVANADAELKDLEKQIDQEKLRIVDSARDEYEAAKSQVSLLEEKVEQLKGQLTKGNKVAVDLAELKREAAATSNLYASLLTRFHETEAQESLHAPDARVVNEALTPQAPSHPRKGLAFILALASSLTLALTIAFVREFTEHVFRSQKDIERVLGIDHIASLPKIVEVGSKAAQGPLASLLTTLFVRPVERAQYVLASEWARGLNRLRAALPSRLRWQEWEIPAAPDTDRVSSLPRPLLAGGPSEFSEALFLVKNAVECRPARGPSRIVAVFSAEDGEGKSTLALNLADYFALSGSRTLLVDCDLRHGSLTRLLAPDAAGSLAQVARGSADAESVIVTDPESGFDLIPAALDHIVARPVDLLSSPKVAELLEVMRARYDVILLDTAALGAVVDARPLIRLADSSLLVIEAARTKHAAVLDLLKDSGLSHDKLIGIVLNKVSDD